MSPYDVTGLRLIHNRAWVKEYNPGCCQFGFSRPQRRLNDEQLQALHCWGSAGGLYQPRFLVELKRPAC